ncbi:MAG: hypothetical protein AAFU79_31490, partial [Myxococcota bacterium]
MWEVLNTLSQGGVMMYINLGVSIAAVSVVLLRAYALWFRYRMSVGSFADAVVHQVDQGNYAAALQVASKEAHPVAAIAKDILLKADRSDREIDRAYETSTTERFDQTGDGAHQPDEGGEVTGLGEKGGEALEARELPGGAG